MMMMAKTTTTTTTMMIVNVIVGLSHHILFQSGRFIVPSSYHRHIGPSSLSLIITSSNDHIV